jgi:hypothetical protein
MPIVATDVQFFLTGGAANADPNLSLGGVVSTTQVASAINNLFDDVASAESSAGDTEYRAISIKNNHLSLSLFSAVIYLTETTAPGSTVEIAWDVVGTQTVANESTSPTGLTFTAPLTKATGIALGTITPGQYKRVWVKRIISVAAAAFASDTGILNVAGDTA